MRRLMVLFTLVFAVQNLSFASPSQAVSEIVLLDLQQQKKDLILNLYKIGAVKFGEFKLKSGLFSPIYFDLRTTISYPEILESAANAIAILAKDASFDVVCGVPYGAIPVATAVSLNTSLPLIMCRKEAKNYGLKKMVEGSFKQGSNCLLIEDVVTTGSSVIETAASLENEGVHVQDVFVLVDRKQGGRKNLESKGRRLHAVLTTLEIVETLSEEGLIDEATTTRILEYVKANSID